MTRIERIIASARVVLADRQGERYTDTDLFTLLNEGYKDICRHAELLHGRTEVPVTEGDPYFVLPDDCWMITRVLAEGTLMPLKTHHELDLLVGYGWESEVGKPKAIVYDRRNQGEGKIYPIPSSDLFVHFDFNTIFGVTTDATDYDITEDFGVVTDSQDSLVLDAFGVMSTAVTTNTNLLLYYLKDPEDLDDSSSDLQTPPMFDTALKYYIVGHAFLIDIDTEYQAKGIQQLAFYDRELSVAKETEMRNATRGAQYTTDYRRVI